MLYSSGQFKQWHAKNSTRANLRGAIKMECVSLKGYRAKVLQGWKATVPRGGK